MFLHPSLVKILATQQNLNQTSLFRSLSLCVFIYSFIIHTYPVSLCVAHIHIYLGLLKSHALSDITRPHTHGFLEGMQK